MIGMGEDGLPHSSQANSGFAWATLLSLKVSARRTSATVETSAEPIMYQATEEPLPVAFNSAVVMIGVAALPRMPDSI
jgi:hypothetical protein